MSIQAQQMLKRLPQDRLPELLRVESHYETGQYRSFYTVTVAVAIARGTAENLLELSDRIKRNKPGGVVFKNKGHGLIRYSSSLLTLSSSF